MERNKWETAIRCLEVALHPNTSDDEVLAAVNGFRRTADGTPLSQVCSEFAGGGMPLGPLAELTEKLDRLGRENLELRRKLALEEAAQAGAARQLDAAHRRIYELTEEAASAQRFAEAVEREFAEFRAAYASALNGIKHENIDPSQGRSAAERSTAVKLAEPLARPFSAFLAEARLAADQAAAVAAAGNGSGRRPMPEPGTPWTV